MLDEKEGSYLVVTRARFAAVFFKQFISRTYRAHVRARKCTSIISSCKSARGCLKILLRCKGLRIPSPSERQPCVWAMRVHVATIRRPRQAIRRRQCAPFSRLLYVFPPLLRILCRNKFFLRRIKILERHSEYLARARRY